MARSIKTYLKGVTSSYVSILITSLLGLWLTPFILRFISSEEYGFYTIIGDIIVWLSLLQLGTAAVFNSKAAQLIGKKDHNSLNKYASTTFYSQLVIALVVVIAGLILSLFLDKILNLANIDKKVATIAFIICVIGAGVALIRQTYSAILIANRQIHIDNYLNIALFVVQAGITVAFLLMGFSLISMAFSQLISILIITAIAYIRIRNLPIKVTYSINNFSFTILNELLSKGVWFTVGGLAGIFIVKIDRFLLGKYISLAIVTNYYITSRLYDYANKFFQNYVNISRPYIAQYYAQKDFKKLSHIYSIFLNSSLFITSLAASLIYLLNAFFVKIWVGEQYYMGNTASFLIAINFVLQSAILPNRALLASTIFKVRRHNLIRLFEGLLKFVLSIVLIQYYGVYGLLIGTIISCLVGSTIFMNKLSSDFFLKEGNIYYRNYFGYFSLILLIIVYLANKNLIIGVLLMIITLAILLLVYYKYFMNEEKKTLLDLIKFKSIS